MNQSLDFGLYSHLTDFTLEIQLWVNYFSHPPAQSKFISSFSNSAYSRTKTLRNLFDIFLLDLRLWNEYRMTFSQNCG